MVTKVINIINLIKLVHYYGIGVVKCCRDQWFNEHKETCMNALGEIRPKQVIGS